MSTCAQAKEALGRAQERVTPLLMVDIDGVISLFGGWALGGWQRGELRAGVPSERRAPSERDGSAAPHAVDGSLHSIDGMPHFLSSTAAAHLLELRSTFDIVWASGWEERANEHLPHLLGLPTDLPFLRFARAVGRSNAHWKLDAIDAYARDRPLAWIDDALNEACHAWARERSAPTLLVQTEPKRGLTELEATQLARWARDVVGTGPAALR